MDFSTHRPRMGEVSTFGRHQHDGRACTSLQCTKAQPKLLLQLAETMQESSFCAAATARSTITRLSHPPSRNSSALSYYTLTSPSLPLYALSWRLLSKKIAVLCFSVSRKAWPSKTNESRVQDSKSGALALVPDLTST